MLNFSKASNSQDIEDVYNHNMSAYFDSDEFHWSLQGLKDEQKKGWEIFAVHLDDEIIAAFFLKEEKEMLLTKQTPIKLVYQGHGYSHRIKEKIEEVAKERKYKSIVNICAIDNFRMVALNESHGYRKNKCGFNHKQTLVEWLKSI